MRKPNSFYSARDLKRAHYDATASALKTKFSNVAVDTIVVGGRGVWDPKNYKVFLKFCSRKYLSLMKRLCVADCISWSRRVYNEHVSGRRHYDIEDEISILRYSPYSDSNPYANVTVNASVSAANSRGPRRRCNCQRGSRYPYNSSRYTRYSPAPASEVSTLPPIYDVTTI